MSQRYAASGRACGRGCRHASGLDTRSAAVIGNEVPLLQAIAERPEDGLHRGLSHLQAAEFLYETRLFPDREYTFTHALTHEVAYGSLLLERRRALHARILAALEGLAGERVVEQVERLAHHALLGEVWVKAVAYGRQAGTKAAQRSAYREAVTRFEQALVALRHLPGSRDTLEQAIDLRLELRCVLHPLGAVERMLEVMREATTLAETLDDPRRLGWAVSRTALAYWQRGNLDHALESAHRALSMGVALDDVPLQASAYWSLGVAYQALGAYAEGIDHLTRNIGLLTRELSQASWDMRITSLLAVTSRAQLARCLAEVGAFTDGITHGGEAVRLAEALKRPYDWVSASLGIGHLYLRKGDLDKAIAVLEGSLELCRVGDVLLLSSWVGSALGGAYAMCGRVAEGLPLLEQAVEQAAAMRFMVHHSSRVAMLSEGLLRAGRRADAAALATHALALAREYKERGNYAWAVRLKGELAAHGDAPAEADAHYRDALALATELGMRPLQAHCHLGLGTLYAKMGQREQARAELSAAVEMYRAMDMTFWRSEAEAALAQVEGW